MNITLNITGELLEKANGELTITLNYKKSEEVTVSKPSTVEKIISKTQDYLSRNHSSKSNAGMSFAELNKL